MECRHCGKEISDNLEYCPYCAEPKPQPERTMDETYIDRKVASARFWSIFAGILLQIFCLIFMGPILGLVFGVLVFPVCVWAIIYGVHKGAVKDIAKNSRETIIDKQYMMDQTSICRLCGSHNIKIYRNGYEWSKGYWMRIFDVKGGGYVAGMDSNRVRCRCMNCGNDWLTDYDYRLIK